MYRKPTSDSDLQSCYVSMLFFKDFEKKKILHACPGYGIIWRETLEKTQPLPQVSHNWLGAGFSAEAAERPRPIWSLLIFKDSTVLFISSETSICSALQVFSYDVEKTSILKMFWQLNLTFEGFFLRELKRNFQGVSGEGHRSTKLLRCWFCFR